MNRYTKTFNRLKKKREKALIPFIVVGDPDYKTSLEIVKTIINAGADILELGLNFSDPIADGPTIQAADVRAQKAGMNTDTFFRFIKEIRKFDIKIPIGILIYANLIYQRGIDKFYKDAKQAGVDSVVVADLPIEEASPYVKAARKNNIDTIFFITPLTSITRLRKTLKKVRGFIYVISRLGITGARANLQKGTLELLRKIRPKTYLPLCVGFGISKPEHVKAVLNAGADGAIVGSAVVKIIEKNIDDKKRMLKGLNDFVLDMKEVTKY